MPNHCLNRFEAVGDKEEIERFVKTVTVEKDGKETYDLFEGLKPMPSELRDVVANFTEKPDMIEKYGASDWYEWANIHWGTKWGCYNVDGEVIHDQANLFGKKQSVFTFAYDTAWAPGDECLMEELVKWDKLSFFLHYEEPGMGFEGYFFIDKGKVVSKDSRDMSFFPDNIYSAKEMSE